MALIPLSMVRVTLILFFVLASIEVLAQLRYGIQGGVNFSDVVITNYINPDVESEYQIKVGPHAGIFGLIDLNSVFTFRSELAYASRGVKANTNINLHYIHVPLLLQYNFSKVVGIEAGTDIGYLIAAKSRYGDVSNTWNNKLDIGINAGGFYNLSEVVQVGIRYYAGFSSVIDASSISADETVKYQNRVIQLSVSFRVGEFAY